MSKVVPKGLVYQNQKQKLYIYIYIVGPLQLPRRVNVNHNSPLNWVPPHMYLLHSPLKTIKTDTLLQLPTQQYQNFEYVYTNHHVQWRSWLRPSRGFSPH